MSRTDTSKGERRCPVCGGRGQSLLALSAQPIYQHPVPADAVVPEPHSVDLAWDACSDCAHAWQPEFDAGLLEKIYRSHYYTPAPDGLATQFRNDFVAVLRKFGLLAPKRALLEIGASDGDVLAQLKGHTGAARAYAFEPNHENAAVAMRRGLDVREKFFGAAAADDGLEPVDLVYARHVIEHVFDFKEFFTGLDAVASCSADLVLETPSLDHHAGSGSIVPFHVEHIHVFALRSLARLARAHGWGLQHAEVTGAGNLIASFRRGEARMEPPRPSVGALQEAVANRRTRLRSALGDRPLVFWGAGSAGVNLVSAIGREPDLWTDGNPNKVGKKFVGLSSRIISPELAFATARSSAFADPVLVVASSFVDEILPRVRELGWQGEIVDLTGRRR